MAKILIIDDDKDILRLLEFTLKRTGHQIITCTDGVKGLAEVEMKQPDLIVADVMMPKMTGYEFCKRVRSRPESKETPIIIFSARFQPVDKQTALDAGATDYLPKTTSPDVLIQAITQYLPQTGSPVSHATIGFFSLRGGSGVTSLAVNTALALALSKKTKAALVDLAPLGGHAALMLGLRPASSVVNALAAAGENGSLDLLKPHLIEHNSGVQLLASTMSYKQQLTTYDTRLKDLVKTLKTNFSFNIFDLPHVLEPNLAPILQLFDKISLILSPDMPSLQSTAMALQGLAQLGIAENKIVLVVNQISPHSPLSLETIQKAIKRPIAAKIPFEPEMMKAVSNGKPIVLSSPKSAGTAAIVQLAAQLIT